MKTINQSLTTNRFGWRTFGLWVGLTFLGYFLNIINHFPSGFAVAPFNQPAVRLDTLGFVIGAMSGLILGSLQAIALQSHLPRVRWWILSNVIGFGLIHALGDGTSFPVFLVVGGLIIGLMQYLALRRYLHKALLWIPITAVAWFSGFQLGLALNPGAYNAFLGALTYSVITGLAFRYLLAENLVPTENPILAVFLRRWARFNLFVKILLVTLVLVVTAVFAIMIGGIRG